MRAGGRKWKQITMFIGDCALWCLSESHRRRHESRLLTYIKIKPKFDVHVYLHRRPPSKLRYGKMRAAIKLAIQAYAVDGLSRFVVCLGNSFTFRKNDKKFFASICVFSVCLPFTETKKHIKLISKNDARRCDDFWCDSLFLPGAVTFMLQLKWRWHRLNFVSSIFYDLVPVTRFKC